MELAEAAAQARQLVATKVSTGYSWTEIPRWHDGAFWFSDMYNHRIVRLDNAGRPTTVIDASERERLSPGPGIEEKEVVLGGMGWLPDGRLLVNSMNERVVLVWDGASLELYADLRQLATSAINDMVVDADGRAYITQLGYDLFAGEEARDSALLIVEPDGSARIELSAGDLSCGNGITVTADGTQVVVAEVGANRITAFDRAPDGRLSNRRVFAELAWLPDGICLDEQGGVWAGLPGSGVVARFVEGGEMTDVINIPMDQGMGVACVLGGPDRDTLYICAGLEVFDWPKSRAEGLGSIWTTPTAYTAGANRP
jgi:sugar lactone lactonase YvrE